MVKATNISFQQLAVSEWTYRDLTKPCGYGAVAWAAWGWGLRRVPEYTCFSNIPISKLWFTFVHWLTAAINPAINTTPTRPATT